jgi:hypothetical protein
MNEIRDLMQLLVITTAHPERAVQDGLLSAFAEATNFSDATVEQRLAKEPFDYRDLMKGKGPTK